MLTFRTKVTHANTCFCNRVTKNILNSLVCQIYCLQEKNQSTLHLNKPSFSWYIVIKYYTKHTQRFIVINFKVYYSSFKQTYMLFVVMVKSYCTRVCRFGVLTVSSWRWQARREETGAPGHKHTPPLPNQAVVIPCNCYHLIHHFIVETSNSLDNG